MAVEKPGPDISATLCVLLDTLRVRALLRQVQSASACEFNRVQSLRRADGRGNGQRLREVSVAATVVQCSSGAFEV